MQWKPVAQTTSDTAKESVELAVNQISLYTRVDVENGTAFKVWEIESAMVTDEILTEIAIRFGR